MAKNYLTSSPQETIDRIIKELEADKVIIVTDRNVEQILFSFLDGSEIIKNSPRVVIIPGENGKNLKTVEQIWHSLENSKATRQSVVLNIGGGVVTDIGGFAAATFKRGIRTVNFPTTLLGAVDAASGGKTGINFNGLKNEIGAFHMPSKLIVWPKTFSSLSEEEFLSGYAEMVKTALISDRDFYFSLLNFRDIKISPEKLGYSVEKCINIKEEVVEQDPKEIGLRKILNFGHTAGHAFESLSFLKGNPVSHGKAVAHGILVALILSHLKLNFSTSEIYHYKDFLAQFYGRPLINCEDIPVVIEKMKHDKKNKEYGNISFTLLKAIGEPEINCEVTEEEIIEALEIYLDMMM